MTRIFKLLCALALLSLTASLSAPKPAAALSAELAKKCLQMSFAAYPPVRAGTKKGNAAEQRKFYDDCIAHGGSMPATENEQKPPAEPQPKGK